MLSSSVTASSTVLPLNPPCRVGGSSGFAGGRDHPSLNPLAQDLARGIPALFLRQPSVVHNRHHSNQGARSAPFERQWYAKVPSRINLCRYSCKLPPPALRAGRSRLLLLVFRKLQTKSISPPLQGKAAPCLYTARLILSRSVLHSADAAFRTHLPRTRRKARHSLPLSLQGKTRKRCPYGTIYVGPIRSSDFGIDGDAVLVIFRSVPPLQMTKTAWLRGFPASHPSLPAKGSYVAPCLQSRLPCRLQSAPPPPSSPSLFRRPDLPARMSWPTTSIRDFVQALESPSNHASTFIRPAPAAPYRLACSHFCSVWCRRSRDHTSPIKSAEPDSKRTPRPQCKP